ncbi:MAG TPA: hypothetical protein EYQ50_02315 [Verrucomicrobiales bacterium]|jgi:hypothetical protein|nr:hypothetical protein [Verrucomicrobiales bacterium]HIL72233.1 hypothetical protein [Verrucomicrobiota bacterium]
MKIETILLAFLIGLHLAVVQFGFLLNLQVHVSSTYLTYMMVVLSWFCGSLIGLWTDRLGLKSGVLVSTAAYYVSYGIVAANPFSRLTIVLSALCVVIAGLWAGRFFTLFIQRFKQSDSLFLHENNGFLVGIISFFVGFTLLGKSFLLLMPGFLAILILSMGNHPSASPTPERKSKGGGAL